RDRGNHVERRLPECAALVEQRGVERERREGRVAAENSGGEEQPPVLRGVALEGEVAREQPHHQRAGYVLKQRRVGPCGAEQASGSKIDCVAERRPEPAAKKDNEKAHRHDPLSTGEKNRPAAQTESYRLCCAVGVISRYGRLSGDPIPIAGKV